MGVEYVHIYRAVIDHQRGIVYGNDQISTKGVRVLAILLGALAGVSMSLLSSALDHGKILREQHVFCKTPMWQCGWTYGLAAFMGLLGAVISFVIFGV